MRRAGACLASLLVALACENAPAYPDGAPWGAANPAADQPCAACHFESEPLLQSPALTVAGLPDQPVPGAVYELTLQFEDPAIVVAGFQLFAQMQSGEAGLLSTDSSGVEAVGAAIRSTEPVTGDGSASWSLLWALPDTIQWPITIYLAATAANHDGSPFGDIVHFRTYQFDEPDRENE